MVYLTRPKSLSVGVAESTCPIFLKLIQLASKVSILFQDLSTLVTEKEADIDPLLELGILYDLETQMSKPLKVASKTKSMCGMKHALFSPDQKYVVISCEDGSQYAFTVAKGKWCGTSREENNFLMGFQDERQSLRQAIHILPNGLLLTRGLSHQTQKNLYLRDLNDNMRTVKEFIGHVYGVEFIAFNDAKTLAASATADTVVVNGVDTKYVYVWDLEKLMQHSVCKAKGPYSSIAFGGAPDNYVLTNGYNDSKVVVWYIGSRDQPCAEGVPVYNIIGHSKQVIYMQVCRVADHGTIRFDKLVASMHVL